MSLRQLIVPIVAAILALFLVIGFTVGYVQYSINQNTNNIKIAQQRAVAIAIQKNNQLLCGVITVVNQSTKGASDSNHSSNSYSLRLQNDFNILDRDYKCGS
jgi:hypothetical protein